MASLLKQGKLSVALGILFFLLLTYPLLKISNYDILVTGVPLLFLYIFGVWILVIIGLYAMSRRLSSPVLPSKQEPEGHDQ